MDSHILSSFWPGRGRRCDAAHMTLFKFTSTNTATYSPSTSTAPLLPYTPDWILSPFTHPSFQPFSGWCSWMLIANMKYFHRHPTVMGLLENQHTPSTQNIP